MSRQATRIALLAVAAGLAQTASAQLRTANAGAPTTLPGAMTTDGRFFTLPLCSNLLGAAKFNLANGWVSQPVDRSVGFRLAELSAPAGPLPTGGIVFIDEFASPDRLIRWDPDVGVTYMNSQSQWPAGLTTMPHGTSDVVCGISILLVGGNGKLYERRIIGNNAWTDLQCPGAPFLAGKPAVSVDPFSGVTCAAVAEDQGHLWILEDVCGNRTWHTVGATGQPGDDPLAYCTGVGAGANYGKFFVTADYFTGPPADLYEAGYDAGLNAWGWYNHGHPDWATGFAGFTRFHGTPVAAFDGDILILSEDAFGDIEVAYLQYANGSWQPWVNLGRPENDSIIPGSLISEDGSGKAIAKGKSGSYWMLRDNGAIWTWYKLGSPNCP